MPWPTWQHSAALGVVCVLAVVALRTRRPTRGSELVLPFARELAVLCGLYTLWRVAKKLPLAQSDRAVERAWEIVEFQETLGLPSEMVVQRWILAWEPLAWLSSAYYAGVHVPAMIAFLIWAFTFHRPGYGTWRNRLALLTGASLLIRFVHVAPPRFLPELGFIDVAAAQGMDVYGPVGTGVSGQFVAMPSLHVAWAAVVAFGAVGLSSSPWRWLVFAHLPVTAFVVSATGHHWWLDGVVAVALLVPAVVLERLGTRWWAGRSGYVRRHGARTRPPSLRRDPSGARDGDPESDAGQLLRRG